MLSRDDIRRALLALASELGDLSARCEILVVGGAAIVLLYGAREAWRDDVDIEDARLLLSKLPANRDEVWALIEPHLIPGRETKAYSPSVISGRPNMELRDLVRSLLAFDTLAARQWVADSVREGLVWTTLPAPTDVDPAGLAVAAGIAELLSERIGQVPPPWTQSVERLPVDVYLVKAALTMPRLRKLCEQEGPEPLRRRGILAPPEFLKVA